MVGGRSIREEDWILPNPLLVPKCYTTRDDTTSVEFLLCSRPAEALWHVASFQTRSHLAFFCRVIEGLEVVRKIASLPVNKDNSGSGFFQMGKLIGDRRAIVAERGFNRPFAKVMVASCGEVVG